MPMATSSQITGEAVSFQHPQDGKTSTSGHGAIPTLKPTSTASDATPASAALIEETTSPVSEAGTSNESATDNDDSGDHIIAQCASMLSTEPATVYSYLEEVAKKQTRSRDNVLRFRIRKMNRDIDKSLQRGSGERFDELSRLRWAMKQELEATKEREKAEYARLRGLVEAAHLKSGGVYSSPVGEGVN